VSSWAGERPHLHKDIGCGLLPTDRPMTSTPACTHLSALHPALDIHSPEESRSVPPSFGDNASKLRNKSSVFESENVVSAVITELCEHLNLSVAVVSDRHSKKSLRLERHPLRPYENQPSCCSFCALMCFDGCSFCMYSLNYCSLNLSVLSCTRIFF